MAYVMDGGSNERRPLLYTQLGYDPSYGGIVGVSESMRLGAANVDETEPFLSVSDIHSDYLEEPSSGRPREMLESDLFLTVSEGLVHPRELPDIASPSGDPAPNPVDRPLVPFEEEEQEEESIVMAGLQPPETLTCNICFDNKPSMYFLTLQNCGHTFCIDCIRTVFEMNISQLRTNLECLYCTTEVSVSDVSLVVSELSFDKFLDFSLRRCLARTPNIRYCLAPDCPFACIMDKVSSRDDNHFVCRREQCGQEYCNECKSAWHPGKSCQQVKSEVAIDVVEGVAGTEILTKQCPVCHVTVEKMADGSCNQVKCLFCGEDFCWLCGKKITEMHYLSPTGCPLYGSHQWSQRKLWCCRTGLWLLAPFVILLVALILIPAIIVLLPVGIGVLFNEVCVKKSRKGCKVFITLVAICATLPPVALIVALLVAVLFIPIALFYVYVIIPVHLVYTRCKSDGA